MGTELGRLLSCLDGVASSGSVGLLLVCERSRAGRVSHDVICILLPLLSTHPPPQKYLCSLLQQGGRRKLICCWAGEVWPAQLPQQLSLGQGAVITMGLGILI